MSFLSEDIYRNCRAKKNFLTLLGTGVMCHFDTFGDGGGVSFLSINIKKLLTNIFRRAIVDLSINDK